MVEREIAKGKKVMATIVDLKAAFDSVDRGIWGKSLEKRKVSVKLRERIIEIYEKRGESKEKNG